MGKFFIKLGLWIQDMWCKFQCKWNWMIAKLLFDVSACPNKNCTCK